MADQTQAIPEISREAEKWLKIRNCAVWIRHLPLVPILLRYQPITRGRGVENNRPKLVGFLPDSVHRWQLVSELLLARLRSADLEYTAAQDALDHAFESRHKHRIRLVFEKASAAYRRFTEVKLRYQAASS